MRILVLRHVPHEDLGIFVDILGEEKIAFDYLNLYEGLGPISMENYNALIILGGPMNVYETDQYPFLANEELAIKDAILKKIPVLGICLGAQLIAKALGAKVFPNDVKEIGWYPLIITDTGMSDPLCQHFNFKENVFQWHGDTFDLPEGAMQLASSPACRNQAFRFGDRVYGLQFHIEVTQEMVEEWLKEPENMRELAGLAGKIDPEAILKETPGRIEELNKLGRRFFKEFLGLVKKNLGGNYA